MHPPGFHRDAAAQARCWGCSDPSKLQPTEADLEKARKLIVKGWMSTSNKYRSVARVLVPPPMEAITFSADVPRWLQKHVLEAYVQWTAHGARCERDKVEHLELTVGEFRAFKVLGGRMA
jgi:hypothetical protein